MYGYKSRFLELQSQIQSAVPEAEVTGSVGRDQSFEVSLNDQMLFSKLDSGGFPNNDQIVKQVVNYDGGNVDQVTDISFPGCSIL
ncbi:migration and invasion enhancer 1-like [Anneissia japonica]|uniref:migration and invasion enhancer 1-like n=1 Tax=Anneissia japonica TaxID=1529436 RepID=UPI0014258CFA|nr:migration and invasion enhancer 1-like [Anneissia japonica]